MTSIRYFNAFLLSALTFSLLYFGYLFLPKEKKIIKPAPSKVIKIALVMPPKKVVKPVIKKVAPAPIMKPTITPILPPKKVIKKRVVKKKIIQKPKPKKIVKKKRVVKKHKPKKVIKKRIIKKPKPKKVIKKKIVEEYVETYVAPAPVYVAPKPKVAPIKKYVPAPKPVTRPISQPIVQPTIIQPTPMVKNSHQNNHYRKAFLQNIRSQIIANKSYPRIAKRRHIEGDIKVRFDISENGEVNNIRFINGKRIFYKSVKKSIERTFPIAIPSNVKGELPIMDVSVTLHFKLR